MEEFVRRMKNGEEDALREVMRLYGDYFLRIAFLLLKDRYEAEEVVQDMFVTAYEKMDTLLEANKLKSWMTSITLNLCRRRLRRWSVRHIFLRSRQEDDIDMVNDQSAEDVVIQLEGQEELAHHLQALEYQYREVLILYYFSSYHILEISELLGMKENTVKSNLARGRKRLKERLECEKYER
ncbi:RNA polymerase sigma factor [Alkalihalobacterium alkalinitrilicum]|uniref:RNA polymerase sigma factor n=1 Tax=Alkalihalobacterium alkalinitrilicum TaxID=427920 RepID=UPI000995DC63|nr:sigma-70 family RNA polymerase sigma factor [Alkalihalobacterium alkalinitrilicum]